MITKNNPTAQSDLFTKAENVLAEYTTKEARIDHIDDYFACLKTLAELEIKHNLDPIFTISLTALDEPFFEIEANTRDIDIPEMFRQGVTVQGDDIAEIIYFKINRYFDAIDLAEKQIVIQWQHESDVNSKSANGNNKQFLSAAYKRSLSLAPGYIVFGWPLSKEVTSKSGNIHFSVRFYSLDEDPVTKEQFINYSFSTITKMIKIKPSLNFNLSQDALNNILDYNKRVYDNLRDSTIKLEHSLAAPTFTYYVVIHEDGNIELVQERIKDLPAIFGTKAEILETSLATGAQAGSKPVSYEWYRLETEDAEVKELLGSDLVTTKYVPVGKDEKYNPYEFYYENTGTEEEPQYTHYAPKDSDVLDDTVELYTRYSILTPNKAGYYQAIARNSITAGAGQEAISEMWLVPFAEEPIYTYTPDSKKVYLDEDSSAISINATVSAGELSNAWYFGNSDKFEESKIDANLGTSNTIVPEAEGYYFLKATNQRNNSNSKLASEGVLATYHASVPRITNHFINDSPQTANDGYIANLKKGTMKVAIGPLSYSDDPNKLKYEWYYKGTEDGTYALVENGTKVGESDFTPVNIGYYYCKIYNTYKGDTSFFDSTEFVVA